jgi:hypothetical protein
MIPLLVLCAAVLPVSPLIAADEPGTVAASGPRRVSLIELYTSEGCSSCPPAEKRLGALVEARGLWTDWVPVAFHVDYWDYLGWKDGLASPVFTARQQAYAQAWNSSSVYTPEFVVDGREWTGDLPEGNPGTETPGRLVIEKAGPREFRVVFFPEGGFSGGNASLALLGFDRAADVRAGENAGRKLVHQFVALELEHSALARDGRAGGWAASVTVHGPLEGRLGIAAWVSPPGGQAPLQAAGGWLAAR